MNGARLWCERACSGIRFAPDKRRVMRELTDHIEDSTQSRIDGGTEPEAAERDAVSAMGDPDEVSRQLAAVHSPWAGRWLTGSLLLLAAAAVLAALCFIFSEGREYTRFSLTSDNCAYYDALSFEGGVPCNVLSGTCRAGKYLFKITDARISQPDRSGARILRVSVRAYSPLPWADYPIALALGTEAEDGMGNVYRHGDGVRSTAGETAGRGLFYSDITAYVRGVPEGAQWLRLSYSRLGADVSFLLEVS